MDHATSLSQVQRANLNLLMLMRDAAMREAGLQEVRFRFDFEGTAVVTQS